MRKLIALWLCLAGSLLFAEGPPPNTPTVARAVFGGGCFWCMEQPFEKLPGVSAAISGYMGGEVYNPTYAAVTTGTTGHAEVVLVMYDPNLVSYQQLLDVFWRQIDPTDPDGQFIDRGSQYRTGIFYFDEQQKMLAERSKAELKASNRYGDKKIITPIEPADRFWRAEEYHQNFFRTNEYRYKYYRYHSGRDQYLDKIWRDER